MSRQESMRDVFIKKQYGFSICDKALFSEANKTLSSYLKQLVKQGKISATVHKIPLTVHTIKKLYEKGELDDVDTHNPRVLLQTAWFLISIYFVKRALKKSMLHLVTTPDGEEYFELSRSEPGVILSAKNNTRVDPKTTPTEKNIFPTRVKTMPCRNPENIFEPSQSQY